MAMHRLRLFAVSAILHYAVAYSRRYAAYDYDLTTPQYAPDGRLLQVEYATNACSREGSNPIVGVCVSNLNNEGSILIMATVSSPPSSTVSRHPENDEQGSDNQEAGSDEQIIESFMKESNQRAQHRIVEVPLSTAYGQHTSTMLIGLSGLLSDATSLLQIAYSHLEEEQRMFRWHRLGLSPVGISRVDDGSSESRAFHSTPNLRKHSQSIIIEPSETVLRLSRAIADECQKHAFGGGLRPFGASLLIAGVDASSCGHKGRVAMSETIPNGGLRSEGIFDVDTCCSTRVMVSGGAIKSHDKLRSSLQSQLQQLGKTWPEVVGVGDDKVKDEHRERLHLRQVLRSVISSLVDEWYSRGDPFSSSSGSSFTKTTRTRDHSEQQSKQQKSPPLMEVVIVLPQRGAIRLTQSDVHHLMQGW